MSTVRVPRWRRLGRWLSGLLAAVVVSTFAGMAVAVWHANASVVGSTINAGDLNISLGALSWECPEQGTTGDDTSFADLLLAPGQSLALRQEIHTVAVGDNLNVEVSVGFPGLPAGVAGDWHLEAGGAPVVGDVPLGQTLLLPDLAMSDWVVVVHLTLPAGDLTWVDPTASPLDVPSLDLGTMKVTAQQVRCGTGFAAACPEQSAAVNNE
ncbi:MAG: hypothetical protein FWC46_09670 [Actinomycetia bacterium]|nr:hypothetical protein [Actinomycetes bacterium]